MEIIIVLCLIGIVIYFVKSQNKDSNTNSVGKVDEKFVESTLDFYDGFASLCNNHTAKGIFSLNLSEENSNWAEFEMQCSFFSIDGEHATDKFESVKLVYSNIKRESKNWEEGNDAYSQQFYSKFYSFEHYYFF